MTKELKLEQIELLKDCQRLAVELENVIERLGRTDEPAFLTGTYSEWVSDNMANQFDLVSSTISLLQRRLHTTTRLLLEDKEIRNGKQPRGS